jgi:putative transposase
MFTHHRHAELAEVTSSNALGTEALPTNPANTLPDLWLLAPAGKLRRRRLPQHFVSALERVREKYDLCIYGYVIMPEHVHLLVSEPERGTLAQAMQSLKQGVARRLALRAADSFWQARYYDFNVWSEPKFVEKLRYIHRNPVRRGLAARPENWAWRSFRHYLTGEVGVVEIESQWTARKREQAGVFPTVKLRSQQKGPAQAELGRVTLVSRNIS